MTDLLSVLPHFPVGQFARLIPALEKHGISTSDLLTLEAADIGKRTHLPLLDVRRLSGAVLDALHADLGVATPAPGARSQQQRAKSASESEAGPESDDPAGHGDRAAPEHAEAPGAASAGSTSSTSSTSALKNTAASLAAHSPQEDPPPPPPPALLVPPPDDDPSQTAPHPSHPALLLDHQQRWFTGWGDDPSLSPSSPSYSIGVPPALKTPSLGLVWTTQLAVRIALLRTAAGAGAGLGLRRRRWMKVVFAAHARASGVGCLARAEEEEEDRTAEDCAHGEGAGEGEGVGVGVDSRAGPVEFEVWMGGVRAVGARDEDERGGGG
ncbi:uncharacterized protein THITE_116745 [Thermothielavioides terrestris NRRL 8126]|uniref:Uncharacterized protein n=1 Tax=Thermothielavioides terrestris (strain ATCC 38088 / NRRL 8126) TaxID=578455 RepID=G2RHZ2_THETT|nr:uncharacterized protein THITE_116745 [Thermothielavioides terrestris NRRL 8126]AEO71454.1 hypothetical protein THITE_116745 [Thermothielavioides terrestris NRRL 8126]